MNPKAVAKLDVCLRNRAAGLLADPSRLELLTRRTSRPSDVENTGGWMKLPGQYYWEDAVV